MAKKSNRIETLRALVAQSRSLHVKDAAEQLNVSEMTVRRDIREHPTDFATLGGHIVAAKSNSPYNLGQAVDLNTESKISACRHAAKLVQPNDTIFVDCGTTLAHLIDLLPTDKPLTVVCYALNVAEKVIRKPSQKLVLMGGEYHPQTASFALLKDDRAFDSLAINTAFLSAAGLDQKLGATCSSFHEASQKRAAIARAQRNILVIDDSKIGQSSAASFADYTDFDSILTQSGALG